MYKLFLHDVHNSDLQLVSILPDVVDAWEYFESIFFCDEHAPLRRFRVSGRNNPWQGRVWDFFNEVAQRGDQDPVGGGQLISRFINKSH